MDELDYDFHIQRYTGQYDEKDRAACEEYAKRALRRHIAYVGTAVRDAQYLAIIVAQGLKEKAAVYQLRYGVGRRWGLLWSAYENINAIVPVGREEAFSADEVKQVSRDLNTVYINIVGVVDNLAWALRHERGSETVKALHDNRIGLFMTAFKNDACFEALRPALDAYVPWFQDLRERRDPAAHRIPLSTPPAVLNKEATAKYQELENKIEELRKQKKFEEILAVMDEQGKLGVVYPRFYHDPDGKHYPFYPTIPDDLGKLVKVVRAVTGFLKT
jgi:hypothetical protein